MWLAQSLAKPDPAYEHVVEQLKFREFGPEPVEQWPLLHDDLYICRLDDLAHASSLRDAYEVGFRGRKLPKLTTKEKSVPEEDDELVFENTDYSDKVTYIKCDICGLGISNSGMDTSRTISFYFCMRCKRNGNRYELCDQCYEVEVAQGDGKHLSHEPHPHYLRCLHGSLVRQSLSSVAKEGVPDIRRVFCDYCGQLAGHCDADDDIWTCPVCPKEHGVRFELCATCARDLGTSELGGDMLRLTVM